MKLSAPLSVVLALACLGSTNPAFAQTDDDWDLSTAPDQQTTVATVDYSSGVSIVVLCRAGTLRTAILRLPPASPGSAWYDLRLGTGQTMRKLWERRSDGTTVVADSDDRLVRFLKAGGPLSIRSDTEADAPFRMEVDLPTSSTGLDAVLGACGYPTTNDRDGAPRLDDLLIETPVVIMPDRVLERRVSRTSTFQVSISCLVSNGRYTACRSEHEVPAYPADGQMVAAELEGVPVRASDMAAAEGRLLDMVVTGSRRRR